MAKTAPKTLQERSAATAAKRVEFDEKELRHRCRLGTRAKLEELKQWHGFTNTSEIVQNLILNAHEAGPKASFDLVKFPRHEIEITEKVARELDRHYQIEAARIVED